MRYQEWCWHKTRGSDFRNSNYGESKTVTELPSDKLSLLLEVSTRKVTVNRSASGTILTLSPSRATVEIKADGVLIKGVKPE